MKSLVGQTISHYTILEQIGAGGMGVVYSARDLKLGRMVALKFLPPHLISDPTEKARFVREAKAASALDHPNICTIYEIDDAPDGLMFIAMAAYEGATLDARITSGPLPLMESLELAIQAATGLQAAHDKGIVHRDIKSSNLFVTKDGQVKILDFGLARTHEAAQLTRSGVAVGTVPYMSPEQARGESVDRRSDIWSLGVVLFEMLSGRMPFRSAYNEGVVYSILNESPPPVTSLRSDLPMECERIVAKALQKEKDARYQHMDELLVDLKAARKQIEAGALPGGLVTGARFSRKRVPRYAGIAAVVVILAAGGLLLSRIGGKEAASPENAPAGAAGEMHTRSIAVLPFKNISSDPEQDYLCDGMTEEIITNLSNLGTLKVIARTSVMQFKHSEKAVPVIAKELGVETVLEGSIRRSGGRVRVTAELINAKDGFQLWAKEYDRELRDVFVVEDDVAQAIVAALSLSFTEAQSATMAKRHTENDEAHQLYLKGLFHWNKRTLEDVRKAIEEFGEAIGADSGYALAYAGLADAYSIMGYYNWLSPREAFPQAKAAAVRALELDDALAEGHAALAVVKRDYEWDWAGSEREFRRAFALNPGYAEARHWCANLFHTLGRREEALDEINKAKELDPLSLVINADLGRSLYFARQYDRATEQFRATLDLDPDFSFAHVWLGQVYEAMDKGDKAIAEIREGVRLSGRNTIALARLAHACARYGRNAEAREILDSLTAASRREYVSWYDLAIVYDGLGEKDRAVDALSRAYDERSHWMGLLNVDPGFDEIRSDPRFGDLLKKMGVYSYR